jgi:hypothetical protein
MLINLMPIKHSPSGAAESTRIRNLRGSLSRGVGQLRCTLRCRFVRPRTPGSCELVNQTRRAGTRLARRSALKATRGRGAVAVPFNLPFP